MAKTGWHDLKPSGLKLIAAALLLSAALYGWMTLGRSALDSGPGGRSLGAQPAPVEAADVRHGFIELKRTFSGALEATAKFDVAPKVSGRVVRLAVDISDNVSQGQEIAQLDNDEFIQAVTQAKADVAVARANLAEAESLMQIASREVRRIETLVKKNIANEAQFDEARSKELETRARMQVAKAQLARAESSLKTAEIRLGYTRVVADWAGGDDQRVVAERYIDEGDTVSANTPLVQIVELDPIKAVFYVTEKDYARLEPGQTATLVTDAYPSESFEGRVERIAPIFRQATRQAKVELTVDNPQHRLKPGMFVQATVTLGKMEGATIVPDQALTTRNDRQGLFVINQDGQTVAWREVTVGIREGGRVQVEGEGVTGRVITLGQHMLEDGSRITVASGKNDSVSSARKAADK